MPVVRAREKLTAEVIAKRSDIRPDSTEAVLAGRMLERQRLHAMLHARDIHDLARLWVQREGEDQYLEREVNDLLTANALRTTVPHAGSRLRDAHLAFTDLPATFARLAAGDMPAEWFQHLVRSVRHLTSEQRLLVDEQVSTWDLDSIPAGRFRRHLRKVLATFITRDQQGVPTAFRNVEIQTSTEGDGIACLTVTGPAPEILATARRLDQAARAVQDEQRHALAQGTPIPFDPDGTAAETGKPLTLAALRYAIMTRSVLDTGGIEVAGERFRIGATVPIMSLLGLSDAPALLDGVVPIPAPMARKLAAEESTWYRILTEPNTGAYPPLPPKRYRPTPEMLEHIRLLDPVCAVPGCERLTSCNAEADHIIPFNHLDPEHGGRTCVENLQLLCRTHHRLKTAGLLDPTRGNGNGNGNGNGSGHGSGPGNGPGPGSGQGHDPTTGPPPRALSPASESRSEDPAPPGQSGVTNWMIKDAIRIQAAANRDLVTPEIARALQDAWDHHLWLQEIQALHDNGELERMNREEGPIHPAHDDPDYLDRLIRRQQPQAPLHPNNPDGEGNEDSPNSEDGAGSSSSGAGEDDAHGGGSRAGRDSPSRDEDPPF